MKWVPAALDDRAGTNRHEEVWLLLPDNADRNGGAHSYNRHSANLFTHVAAQRPRGFAEFTALLDPCLVGLNREVSAAV